MASALHDLGLLEKFDDPYKTFQHSGADYAETWMALNVDRPWYDDYQSRTDRQIPLVRLVELRSA